MLWTALMTTAMDFKEGGNTCFVSNVDIFVSDCMKFVGIYCFQIEKKIIF